MQLRRKTKRFAALVLAMSMALGCMPVGAWAEATTPTDLPPIIATDGEAVPEPALPSDEQEAGKTDDAPAPEDLEDPDESHGDSEPAACLYGLPEAPLEDISIVNTQIHLTEDAPSFPVMNAVQQPVTLAGLTAEHVRGLHLTDLRIVGARGETVTLHDVE